LGTPNYVSPEQASGAEVDHRSDFYSAGIILFEMLTRRKPFRADNSHAMIHQHLHAPIPLLHAGVAQYQPQIDRLLAKQPADCYVSAEALLAAIDTVSAEAGARA
jgi:serine/threonine protein kinase